MTPSGDQGTTHRNLFYPSTLQVSGIKLGSSGLVQEPLSTEPSPCPTLVSHWLETYAVVLIGWLLRSKDMDTRYKR